MIATGFTIYLTLCDMCGGTSNDVHVGTIDPDLNTIFVIVFSFCTMCKSNGGKTNVGRNCINGKAILKRLDQERRALFVATSRTNSKIKHAIASFSICFYCLSNTFTYRRVEGIRIPHVASYLLILYVYLIWDNHRRASTKFMALH